MASANPHDRRISETLARALARSPREAIDETTPLDQLILREETGWETDGLDPVPSCAECGSALDDLRTLVNYFFKDGPHPWKVMRRVYFLAHSFFPDLVLNMSEEDLSEIFGETRANCNHSLNLMFANLKVNIPGHKSPAARRTYAQIRKNNRNRAGGSVQIQTPATPFNDQTL